MRIGTYSADQFLDLVTNFHGYAAPGVVLGGIMVEAAKKRVPPGTLFDAVSETPKCLPDAIQLLTPCTIGNGWLKIVHLGRFALSLYDKVEGNGVRVYLDAEKVKGFSEIRDWFFSLKSKEEQDAEALTRQILKAGEDVIGSGTVRIQPRLLQRKKKSFTTLCPLCGEAYPRGDGAICLACQGEGPYVEKMDARGPILGLSELTDPSHPAAPGRTLPREMSRLVPVP
jgi:formylmethanofuran dehydrogenase subunit E